MKTYFKLETTNEDGGDYYFISPKGAKLRFAGGSKGRPKFIIQSLIELYGEQEGKEIFSKFLNGIDNIKHISAFKSNTGVFVLYEKGDVFEE